MGHRAQMPTHLFLAGKVFFILHFTTHPQIIIIQLYCTNIIKIFNIQFSILSIMINYRYPGTKLNGNKSARGFSLFFSLISLLLGISGCVFLWYCNIWMQSDCLPVFYKMFYLLYCPVNHLWVILLPAQVCQSKISRTNYHF